MTRPEEKSGTGCIEMVARKVDNFSFADQPPAISPAIIAGAFADLHETHFFNPACQFSTTVMGEPLEISAGMLTRKRLPSAEGR